MGQLRYKKPDGSLGRFTAYPPDDATQDFLESAPVLLMLPGTDAKHVFNTKPKSDARTRSQKGFRMYYLVEIRDLKVKSSVLLFFRSLVPHVVV